MDPAGQVSRRRARNALTPFGIIVFLAACGRSTNVAPPAQPQALPTQAAEESLPSTLEEVRPLRESDPARYERGLRALALSSDATTAKRARTLLALDLFARKQFEASVPALEAAVAANPAIAPYLQLRLIDANKSLGRLPEAISTASSIITDSPSTSAATIAKLELPALYSAAGADANMNAALQRVAAMPIDELTEGEFVSLASKLVKAGRNDAATKLRLRILQDYTQGRFTEQLYTQLAAENPSPIDALSTEEATRLASNLAKSDRYDQALDLLARLGGRSDAATSELYRSVRLRALYNSRNYTQLIGETEGLELDAPLQLMRARAAWRDDKPQEFLDGLARIDKKFPKSREAIEARVLRAKYYVTDEVDYERSIENLSAAIRAGATGTDGENIWTLGFTCILAGRYDDALRAFEQSIRDYPDGDYKTNALFWTGKVQERLQHPAERDAALRQLITEYPYSYYAYRAREILGSPPPTESMVAGAGVFPDVDTQLAKITDPRLAAVRELLAVDLTRDATREMKTLAAAYPENTGLAFLLADTYAGAGETFQAIVILQKRFRQFIRHGGSQIPQRLWQILFPLNYWESIRTEAQKRNLDPYLVASIIRQESGFEPTSVSNAGAVGLMQIMPGEAPRIASQAGMVAIDRQRLFDPMTNIAVGTAEYSQKLAFMNGNHVLAIAAYNAGEVAVGRWLARNPIDNDPDIFVDSIPYAETRLYVKSVTRNRFEYRRVYEGRTEVSQAVGRSSDLRR